MANITNKLQPMTPPSVVGYKIGQTTFVVQCPHCHRHHTHGIAGGLGHRASDCNSIAGYEVTKVIQSEITNKQNRAPNRAQKRRN